MIRYGEDDRPPERLDDTTIVVHTGDYGQCEITTIEAYVKDRWEDEDRDEVPADERYRLGVRYETEEYMRGGGIANSRVNYDHYPSFHAERPTAEDIARLSREMTDDFESRRREQNQSDLEEES